MCGAMVHPNFIIALWCVHTCVLQGVMEKQHSGCFPCGINVTNAGSESFQCFKIFVINHCLTSR